MTEEIKEFKCNLDKQFERYFKEVDGEFKGVIPFMIIYLYQLMIQTETLEVAKEYMSGIVELSPEKGTKLN